ncbi:hypothetical protein AYI70_g9548 [Smittium culicis]|uniref:Uncharacterized protein n=1 Tax=Smittium culicis TaxID=133412 RepID=A0A1R1XAP8_9FUNG|nr:hypothetical protein AYI70_g9548 [Smittium culicis]
MDTNWCFYCGKHISHSDSALYCSESCKRTDRNKSSQTYSYSLDYIKYNSHIHSSSPPSPAALHYSSPSSRTRILRSARRCGWWASDLLWSRRSQFGYSDTNALDKCKQHAAEHCRHRRRLPPTTCRKHPPGQRSRRNRVPRILLLSHPLHRAIKRRKHSSPYPEIAPENWAPLPASFDKVPESSSDRAHTERTSCIV